MTETPPETQQQPYTFVRIKRKRTDAPLDALVFGSELPGPSRKKRLRPGVNVFQFASTVEEASWDDTVQKDLQERIEALAREPVNAPEKPIAPLPRRKRATDSAAPQPQYTIVAQPQDAASVSPSRRPTAPPKVLSAKELEKAKSNIKVYDAVLAQHTAVLPTPVDSDFEVFNDLLQDYLKLNDTTPPSVPLASNKAKLADRVKPPLPSSLVPVTTKAQTKRAEDQDPDPDYVWDVFFHRPGTLQDYANVGNVGTLTGLPASFGDPYESDAESEPEDEADEDSNDEGYYRNDYPDADTDEWSSNETDGSDEWHEASEIDDGEEHEWR